ncbi:hypothetical protein FNF27_07395 [Cafeteria roenbergensis]|uniref:Uncharacterized protein n=1 Tax=Cafeteria roenbergensis TaxID=33653 RepID=A0A5A8DR00_CAFRO|nr:hypothetical protein FNF27_07395 [Cafeteria roenbergensis]
MSRAKIVLMASCVFAVGATLYVYDSKATERARMHLGVIREIAKEQAEMAEKADCEVCNLSQTRFREPTAAEAAGRA